MTNHQNIIFRRDGRQLNPAMWLLLDADGTHLLWFAAACRRTPSTWPSSSPLLLSGTELSHPHSEAAIKKAGKLKDAWTPVGLLRKSPSKWNMLECVLISARTHVDLLRQSPSKSNKLECILMCSGKVLCSKILLQTESHWDVKKTHKKQQQKTSLSQQFSLFWVKLVLRSSSDVSRQFLPLGISWAETRSSAKQLASPTYRVLCITVSDVNAS